MVPNEKKKYYWKIFQLNYYHNSTKMFLNNDVVILYTYCRYAFLKAFLDFSSDGSSEQQGITSASLYLSHGQAE